MTLNQKTIVFVAAGAVVNSVIENVVQAAHMGGVVQVVPAIIGLGGPPS